MMIYFYITPCRINYFWNPLKTLEGSHRCMKKLAEKNKEATDNMNSHIPPPKTLTTICIIDIFPSRYYSFSD